MLVWEKWKCLHIISQMFSAGIIPFVFIFIGNKITLGAAIWKVIFIKPNKGTKKHQVELLNQALAINCLMYDNNSRAIELAKLPTLSPNQAHHKPILLHLFVNCKNLDSSEPNFQIEHIFLKDLEADIWWSPLLEHILKIQEKSTGNTSKINLWSELSPMSQIIENIEQQQEWATTTE